MRLQRLLGMSMTELAERSRQEASKWLERVGVIGRINGVPYALAGKLAPAPDLDSVRALIRTGDRAGAGSRLLDRFRETAQDRFFAGIAREWPLSLVLDRLSSIRDEATAVAEAARRGRFDLLGYRSLSFGNPVDWHLDPVSGRRAPLVHWSRLDPLDPAEVGDSKVVWELNRHQWLVRMGQAYWLTGDERYTEQFVATIQDWMRANPPGMGINWSSSLEVALRLISWCWALFLFRGSKALRPEFYLNLLGGICAHATHIERYLSYYFAPNTHLTGEALGLFYAGVVFPELRSAGRWRELGARILVEQSGRQVLPDGVYFEQSTCYQRYTVEIYLHFLMLAARNGVTVPSAVTEQVQRMLDFLLAIRHGDGSVPRIGDADGGWLLPLAGRTPDDSRSIFSAAAAFFGRTDYAWAAGELAPETFWLLGHTGKKSFGALRPTTPPTPPSRLFPTGGYVVMRNGWEDRAHQLIFDVGPLGCPMNAGHGHADVLSIQCAAFGVPYLVDPGTFCYSADPDWRDFFRSTTAHNTITVDGAEQAEPDGIFSWKGRPRVRVRRWLSTETFDLVDAEHDAYLDRPDPVTHRRRALFIKPWGWVVVDDLIGAASHHIELRYQFAPLPVTMNGSGWIRAQGAGDHGLLVRALATMPLRADLREGELNPKQGWYSPDYGQRKPAPVLTYSATTSLPLRIVSLLVPAETPTTPPPPVSPLIVEGPDGKLELAGLTFGHKRECILITEQDIVFLPTSQGSAHWRCTRGEDMSFANAAEGRPGIDRSKADNREAAGSSERAARTMEHVNSALEITDLGARRQVTVSNNGRAVRFETALSEPLVRWIFADKGPRWVKDSIARFEDPEYVERPLARLIARFFQASGKISILDLGCGSGASSAALARMGFRVIGIDPCETSARIGTQAARECGVGGQVTFVVGAGESLPIRAGSFDVVLLCAVVEHVPPADRRALLQEAWRALRAGGLLLIHDTPNRLWPFDGHTTGLWFMTWLPRRLAFGYARRWSRIAPRGATDEELVSGGLCAPTYWEIRKALPHAICVNLEAGDDVRFAFQPTDGKPRPLPKSIARRGIIALLRSIGWILRRMFGVPPAVVLQNLDLCFRKSERLGRAG